MERIERRGNKTRMREQETRESWAEKAGGESVMDSADQLIYSGAV